MSIQRALEDLGAGDQARTDPQSLDSQFVGQPIPGAPTSVPSEFKVYVDGEGFPTGELEMALQESLRGVQTPVIANRDDNGLGNDGFSKAEVDRAIAESRQDAPAWRLDGVGVSGGRVRVPIPTTATLVSTDYEDDNENDDENDVDADGFSRSQQRQAEAASRRALMLPFYGATTSRAAQQLSDEEWTTLEQFAATSLSLKEMVQP
ncbi:hypothetical protein FRC01_007303 [Tulasnella sp. 417]|nr:hypothetical protein FRC01_007303 [Tulasnella sp. 417]